jgi:hypothetical protein
MVYAGYSPEVVERYQSAAPGLRPRSGDIQYGAQPAAKQPASGGKVRVSKDGEELLIDAADLEEARADGYTEVR